MVIAIHLIFAEQLLRRFKNLLCDERGHPTSMLENEEIFQMVMSEFYSHEEQVSHELIVWTALSYPKNLYMLNL